MEEKERYELIGYCSYRDTETGLVRCNYIDLLNQQDKRIKELEKELEYMTKQAKKFNSEAQKYYEDAYCNNFQNQKAIEELKLALDNFRNRPTYFDVARQELCLSEQDKQFIDFINNQIKSLKGENE